MQPTDPTGLTIAQKAWFMYQREQALADSRALRLLLIAHGKYPTTAQTKLHKPTDDRLRAYWHHRGQHLQRNAKQQL